MDQSTPINPERMDDTDTDGHQIEIAPEETSKEELTPLEVPSDIQATQEQAATPGSAPATPALLIPSLRGQLSVDGVNHICKGVWALSDDYHDLPGQTSEFEFRLAKPAHVEDRTFPMNGKYQGFFYLKQPPPLKTSLKIEDKDMNMTFTRLESGEYSIDGEGSNKFGKFTLRGTMQESGAVQMYRVYVTKPLPLKKGPVAAVSTPGPASAKKRPVVDTSPRAAEARVRRKASFGTGFDTDDFVSSVVPSSAIAQPQASVAPPAAFSPRPTPLDISNNASTPRVSDAGRVSRLPQHLVKCSDLLKEMAKQPQNIWFLEPVDHIKLNIPDYPLVVKEPMDLGTIRNNLDRGLYSGPDAFAEHVRLVFRNALMYNQLTDHPVHIAAKEMSHRFEERYRMVMSQLGLQYETAAVAAARKSKSGSSSATNKYAKSRPSFGATVGPRSSDVFLPPALDTSGHYLREMQRRMEEMQNEIMLLRSEVKQSELRMGSSDIMQQGPLPLSFDEKTALIAEITRLPHHKMVEVVEIIKEAMPNDLAKDNGDDIEVPLDDLDTATLRKLQRFVAQEAASKRKRPSAGGSSKSRATSAGEAKKRKASGSMSPGTGLIGGVEEEVEAADLLFSAESFEELRASANFDDTGSDDDQ